MKKAMHLTAMISALAIAVPALAIHGVSPGATDRMAQVNDLCPTFSWGADGDALGYELVAYALPEDPAEPPELKAGTEVLYVAVPTGATSWTPSAEHCVAPGGRYVWFVRAVTELASDQVVEVGTWSEGRYFQVPAGPTEDEVARAIEVLERWQTANRTGSLPLSSANGADPETVAFSGTGPVALKSVPAASAAIRGEHPNTAGEAYGVVGTSASPDGAGVAAANLDGGPDLVLDGSADGQVDTLLSQYQVDRPSPVDETFYFRNTGAGFLNLQVDGTVSASRVTGDELWAASGLVIDDEGNWQGAGSTIPCTECVGWGDIADHAVSSDKLRDQGASQGQVLKSTGTSVVWADDLDGDLDLPYYSSVDSDDPGFWVAKNGAGTGVAIYGESNNSHGISGFSNASGQAAGVYGESKRAVGATGGSGVYGLTRTPEGVGVSGVADWTDSPEGTGVSGSSKFGTGVRGSSYRGDGVTGHTGGGGFGVVGSYSDSESYGALGASGAGVKGVGHLLEVGGSFTSGTGNGVVAHSTGGGRDGAALYAISGNFNNGVAIHGYVESGAPAIVGSNLGTGYLLQLRGAGGNERLWVTNSGDLHIDGSLYSGGGDFAELLPAFSDDLEPGDVLAIAADGRLMKSRQAYQASVVGVYSTRPGLVGSALPGDDASKVPLAVLGVVPVKTCDENGPVRPGDMLVASSIPGHAMRAGEGSSNGRVIGKALSSLESGEGVITMLVVLQ